MLDVYKTYKKFTKSFKGKIMKLKAKKLKERIQKSNLFDAKYYLRTYSKARLSSETPLEHFIKYGLKEKRKPNSEFDPIWYRDFYEDVRENGVFPFVHYILHGQKEKRFQNLYEFLSSELGIKINQNWFNNIKYHFDEKAYLEINHDIKDAIKEGIFKSGWEHFCQHGLLETKKGLRQIDFRVPPISEKEYIASNEDIKKALKSKKLDSALEHFLIFGKYEYIRGERKKKEVRVYNYSEVLLTNEIKNKINSFEKKPFFSIIIPVYNVEPKWLKLAIESIEKQWYEYWEICIVDDKSTHEPTISYLKSLNNSKIKIKFLEKNLNISGASNEALKLASGEYIVLMDNDDELTPDALYEVTKSINEKDAEFIYSDEDKLELDESYSEPHFKPNFSPDMFLSQNYLSHLGVIKKELITKVGGWTIGLEGSQDYDLYLKVLEHTDKIYHISKVLYHWRKVEGSTAAQFSDKSYAQEAGRVALQNAVKRRGFDAFVKNGLTAGTYKVEYKIKNEPLISIVIPFKDKPELLDMCIHSILQKSTYQNYEIIGISNNSKEEKTFSMMKLLKEEDKRVNFYEYNEPFNYSAINNYAVNNYSQGEHIIFLNNDIKIITNQWIEELLAFSQREDVGVVGAKLYFPDNKIQHAGVIVGIGGVAGHSHKYFTKHDLSYFNRINIVQNLSAVTAACLMVKKGLFNELRGLDETNLKVAFNDVDFCLRAREKGYNNIYTPYCEAYHYESISRGKEDNPQKIERFNNEVLYMKRRHKNILESGDPYYNINLTLEHENFGLK